MTNNQIAQVEMFRSTLSFMDNHSAVWNAIPIVNTYKTRLSEITEAIEESAKDQEESKVAIGQSLREIKLQVATKMDILDDLLEAYALDTDNDELLVKSKNSKTDYYRLSHEEFEVKVKNIISLLEQNLSQMADYGMSETMLDEVKTTFNSFETRRGMPRAYQIASRIATTNLEELFVEGLKMADRMDNVLKRFKTSSPAFYQGYVAARMAI